MLTKYLAPAIGVFGSLVVTLPAFAQNTEVAVPVVQASQSVNLTWLANLGIAVAAACVVPVSAYLIQLLMNLSFIKKHAHAQALVQTVLQSGASIAATQLGNIHINDASIAIKSAAIARGVAYTVTGAADSLKLLGYDPTTVQGADHIAQMVEARIPGAQAYTGVVPTGATVAAPAVTDLIQGATLMEGPALATADHAMNILDAITNVKAGIASLASGIKAAGFNKDPAVPEAPAEQVTTVTTTTVAGDPAAAQIAAASPTAAAPKA